MNLDRVQHDWEVIADNSVMTEQIKGTIYGFTDELSALRLFHKFNQVARNKKTRMGFSENLNTWYFAIDLEYSE